MMGVMMFQWRLDLPRISNAFWSIFGFSDGCDDGPMALAFAPHRLELLETAMRFGQALAFPMGVMRFQWRGPSAHSDWKCIATHREREKVAFWASLKNCPKTPTEGGGGGQASLRGPVRP
jgi:hypothetical protein